MIKQQIQMVSILCGHSVIYLALFCDTRLLCILFYYGRVRSVVEGMSLPSMKLNK